MNNVIRVDAVNGECTVTTNQGRYVRWPGRTLPSGQPYWTWTPVDGTLGRCTPVTVPATISALEEEHRLVKHPTERRLRIVKAVA